MTARDDMLDAFHAQLRTAFDEALHAIPAPGLAGILADLAVAILDDNACTQYAEQVVNDTHLKSIDFRNGMAMDLQPSQDMVAAWVGAARGFLGDAPNYTETPVEMEVKVAESPESFIFILQRAGKVTPHQARLRAEAERDQLRAGIDAMWKRWFENAHAGLSLRAAMEGIGGDLHALRTTPDNLKEQQK